MWLMIFGLLLFSGVHLVPVIYPELRTSLINKLGLWQFKGLFSILTIGSIVCIVIGWRSIEPAPVYTPPTWGRYSAYLLVLVTFLLFVSPYMKTNIRRFTRHGQLNGVILWSFGHLLANGDNRSLIFFAWFAIWAILEMMAINRREGEWEKPPAVPVKYDAMAVAAGIVLFAVLLAVHQFISGVRLV